MPKKKKVDAQSLIKMVVDRAPQKDIMEKFGYKTSNQLKVAYANALMEAGKVPEIQTGRSVPEAGVKREITVSKRGSLVIPKALIQELGLQQGDCFQVRSSKAGLSLRKV